MLIDTQKLREAVTKHYTKKANIISNGPIEPEKEIDLLTEIGRAHLEIEHLIAHVELIQAKFID